MQAAAAERYCHCMAQAWERQPDPRWQALFPDAAALQAEVNRWRLGEWVPGGVVSLLRVARDLLVDSYFVYSYSFAAAEKALQALEACLRGCLPIPEGQLDRRGLNQLISEGAGARRGLLSPVEFDVLRSTAGFRNDIAHGKITCHEDLAKAYGPTDVLMFVQSIHEAVTDLYRRAIEQQVVASLPAGVRG